MTCEDCLGRRIVFGFGGMKHECKACKGSGRIDKEPIKAEKDKPKVDKQIKD